MLPTEFTHQAGIQKWLTSFGPRLAEGPLAGDNGNIGAVSPPHRRHSAMETAQQRTKSSRRIRPRTPASPMAVQGRSLEECEWRSTCLIPNVLTLGFARRFTTYKRPNLLLHDPERLLPADKPSASHPVDSGRKSSSRGPGGERPDSGVDAFHSQARVAHSCDFPE